MHLCPRNATTWRNRPCLPSKACKLTAVLTAKAYSAAGHAASALHAMAILQVHQAKALKQVHEGSTDPGLIQQFSAVQQQTEAIQHILPRRDAPSTAAPGARPQSARCRGRPPASSKAAPPQAESTHRPVRRASRRRAVPPASLPGPKSSRKSMKRP